MNERSTVVAITLNINQLYRRELREEHKKLKVGSSRHEVLYILTKTFPNYGKYNINGCARVVFSPEIRNKCLRYVHIL